MKFLLRQRHPLLVLAVLALACVMVVQQNLANQSAHLERREDFLVLHERGHSAGERLYQILIQELPDLDDRSLVDDLQRTAMLVDRDTPNPESLVWKYHISVTKELRKRAEQRIARTLETASKQ